MRDAFDALLSVEDAGVDGAGRAGLRGVWLDRGSGPYPDYFQPPTLAALSLPDLAEQLDHVLSS